MRAGPLLAARKGPLILASLGRRELLGWRLWPWGWSWLLPCGGLSLVVPGDPRGYLLLALLLGIRLVFHKNRMWWVRGSTRSFLSLFFFQELNVWLQPGRPCPCPPPPQGAGTVLSALKWLLLLWSGELTPSSRASGDTSAGWSESRAGVGGGDTAQAALDSCSAGLTPVMACASAPPARWPRTLGV